MTVINPYTVGAAAGFVVGQTRLADPLRAGWGNFVIHVVIGFGQLQDRVKRLTRG